MNRDTGVTGFTSVTQVLPGKGPARDSVLLGKYRVESTLGFGGMGLVLRALNLDLNEAVAIKLLREDVQLDPDNITRFLREAKNAVRLKSEHVARVRDVGVFEEDGRPYMVMELLEGLDLGKLLIEEGTVERRRAVDLVLQACDAIAEAHSLGIVHRDIKPTNLFVTKRRDGSDLLKVLDFGIAKASANTEMSLTQTSSMLGTPAYMSPEQMRSARTVDPRSDIWSLGCVLYELVEGRQPFDANNFAELCVMVAIEEPSPLVLAPELAPVIARSLEKTVDGRYQNVAELAAALIPYASDPETAKHQVMRIERMLMNAPKSYRDSTPVPTTRGSNQRISNQRISSQAIPRTPTPTGVYDATAPVQKSGSKGGRLALMLLVAAALIAVGIGAGLFATRGTMDEPMAEAAGADAAIAPVVVDATAVEATFAQDASVVIAPAIDAGVVEAVEEVQKPVRPPKRPPQPKKNPPKPPKPAGQGSAPPPPKCDPFENPNGCK